jgi:hypothetical protein
MDKETLVTLYPCTAKWAESCENLGFGYFLALNTIDDHMLENTPMIALHYRLFTDLTQAPEYDPVKKVKMVTMRVFWCVAFKNREDLALWILTH